MSTSPEYSVNEDDLQGLIFDCDGTLVDTMPAYWLSWHWTCEKYGLSLTKQQFYAWAGKPVKDMVWDNSGLLSSSCMNLQIQALLKEAGKEGTITIEEVASTKHEFNKKAIKEIGTPASDAVVSIAKRYYGKLPLAVASSGDKSDVIESLKSNGIYDLFDAVITGGDVANPKPAPDVTRVFSLRGVTHLVDIFISCIQNKL